ncbi:hypothetical protein HOI26_04780 [Candidatus Woesearchaeota archaeon]|jgi:preprotein translocase subunit SecD|nr:hypothetical protein [Candidatus Woesearchaeota archaeon]
MNWKKLFLNWRVIMLILFVLFALVAIRPQISNEGVTIRSVSPNSSAALGGIENPSPNSQPLSKEKIISINRQPVDNIEDYYSVISSLLGNDTVRVETDETAYTLITSSVNPSELGLQVYNAPTSNLRQGLDVAGGTRVLLEPEEAISQEDLDTTINSLKERLNVYGLSDVVVRSASDLAGKDFILIEMAGVTEEEVKDLLSKQGKFEAKIANQTVFEGGEKDITHVCRSADCSGIDPNQGCYRSGEGYGCNFFFGVTLRPAAAERHGEITAPLSVVPGENGQNYLSEDLVLFLDDVEVDTLRIGASLQGRAETRIQISGSGNGRTEQEAVDNTLVEMRRLQTIMITGSLPVKLEVVKLDTISPTLGKEFLDNLLLVGLFAILAVVAVVAIRYRNIKVVIPMILTIVSEVLLILGFGALVGWNLDLAALAGILIVVGTGVDHLIVITDETLSGESTGDWKKRIKRAMFIVIGAYFTTVAGMLPLLWAGAGLLKGFALTTIAGISFGVLLARPAYAVIIEHLMKE